MKGSHNHEVLGAQNVMQRWEMTYMNSSTYIWNILILKSPEEFEMGFKVSACTAPNSTQVITSDLSKWIQERHFGFAVRSKIQGRHIGLAFGNGFGGITCMILQEVN